MSARTRQARAALAEVLPDWIAAPRGARRFRGNVDVSLRPTRNEGWACCVDLCGRPLTGYTAPHSEPAHVARWAIDDARQTLEIALAAFPKVTP